MSEEHESFIKTPKQLIIAIVLSFVIPIALIVLLTKYVGTSPRTGAGADTMTDQAVAARIAPVAGFELADASGAAKVHSGEDVYNAQCSACHTAGIAGAPKFGDAAQWAARLGQGYDALLTSALKGKGAMAAQGGAKFSDIEIGKAVVYMVNKAGGNLTEPAAAEEKTDEPAKTSAASAAQTAVKVQQTSTPAIVTRAAQEGTSVATQAGQKPPAK